MSITYNCVLVIFKTYACVNEYKVSSNGIKGNSINLKWNECKWDLRSNC